MNESKHTPGPWRYDRRAERYYIYAFNVPVSLAAMYADCPNHGRAGQLANARLIAASPILYAYACSMARTGDEKAKSMLDSLGLSY